MQIATLQVQIVDISNFQLPTSGGFHLFRDIHYASVVEIEAGHSKIGFRFLGFFFNTVNPLAFVKLHHAVSMRIADVIAENGRPCISLHGSIQKISHPLPKENIVSKHKADIVAANKIFGQQKGLRQPFGAFLNNILKMASPLGAVTEQFLIQGQMLGRRDDGNLTDTGKHQY